MRTWISNLLSRADLRSVRRSWLWVAIGVAGLAIHAGTAALRLSTFFPSPRLLDFSAFYASAWAIRLGLSPYNLPAHWLQTLQSSQAIPFTPPPIYNPPFWPWLLMPLTWFSFPVAAWIWLALNMGLLLVSSVVLADLAGYRGWRARGVIFALVVTFGPVFLDLTLGQTSVVLLVATLAMGRCLNIRDGRGVFLATSAAALAVGCKLFPLSWLPAWPLLRRWREAVVGGILVLAIGGLSAVVSPIGSREYWAYLFEERLQTASSVPSVDDQALLAWLDRLVLPLSFDVSGFGVERRTTVVWSPPWTADAGVVRWFGYGLIGLLLLLMLYLLLRSAPDHQEAGFYLWILFGLVALLHIERYNHVLLLPPMAWLWRRGKRQRRVVVAAYTLVGLARLTHLWAMLLPAPWGPLASGFGLYAALGLGGAMVACLWPYHGVVAQEPAWPESQAG